MQLEKLRILRYYGPDLCEPNDEEFDSWLAALPSGAYFYRLRAGTIEGTGTMVLLK